VGAVVAIASTVLAASFLWWYQTHSSVALGADAWAYEFFAFRFREYGLLHDFGSIRTYGYPLFLYFVSFLTGFHEERLSLASGMLQFALLLVAALWLAREMRCYGSSAATAVLAGACLHPVGMGLVTDTLTESLSLPAFVVLAAVGVRLYRGERNLVRWLAAASVLAAFAVMVRPANIVLFGAWHASVIAWVLLRRGSSKAATLRMLLGALACCVAGAAVAWLPQILYNWRHYGAATPLPVCHLGSLQVAYSIAAWKYDTVVAGSSAGAWFFLNPLLAGPLPADVSLLWYMQHPLTGAATLAAHTFSAFSVTSPFTYVRDVSPAWGPALRAFCWSLNVAGAIGAFRILRRALRRPSQVGQRAACLPLVFVILAVAGLIALNAVTAVEVRFNAIPLTVLAAAAVYLAALWFERTVHLYIPGFAAAAVIIAAAVAGTFAMDKLGSPSADRYIPAVDLSRAECFLTGNGSSRPWAEELADYRRFMTRRGGPDATSR
jgi:hypothetical protein